MIRFALSFLILGALFYGVIVAGAWSLQSRIFYPAPLNIAPLAPGFEAGTIQTEDGVNLRIFERPAEQGKPTIVYFHGNAGSLSGSAVSNHAFVEAGYGLILLAYRGYGGNAGEPSESGFYKDGRAVMAYLQSKDVPAENVIFIGNSIGTGTATQMASEFPVKALVLVAPFTALPDVAAEKVSWLPLRWIMSDRFDNLGKIGVLPMPVLIQHGTADDLIPVHHSEALHRRNPASDFQSFEGEGHDVAFTDASRQARLEWVSKLESPELTATQ